MIQQPILIAEIGNNHEGHYDLAVELLESAKDAGADLVKFQAGTAEGFARNPALIPFYKRFELGYDNYSRLIEHGAKIGIPVFFSIWGEGFDKLCCLQDWHKIAARQCNCETLINNDNDMTFISLRPQYALFYQYCTARKAIIMHVVEEYPAKEPRLEMIQILRLSTKAPKIGYSDHTVGVKNCIDACKYYDMYAVEKHFTLKKLKEKSDFRDHIHSATPDEFLWLRETVK